VLATEPPEVFVGFGAPVARCGNSGNSTEPHVHLPVSDSLDWTRAHGLPFVFRRSDASTWLPATSEIVGGEPGSR
jgi:murein DD-endopeptidase MepM/ murein hydrolase activator NlpD